MNEWVKWDGRDPASRRSRFIPPPKLSGLQRRSFRPSSLAKRSRAGGGLVYAYLGRRGRRGGKARGREVEKGPLGKTFGPLAVSASRGYTYCRRVRAKVGPVWCAFGICFDNRLGTSPGFLKCGRRCKFLERRRQNGTLSFHGAAALAVTSRAWGGGARGREKCNAITCCCRGEIRGGRRGRGLPTLRLQFIRAEGDTDPSPGRWCKVRNNCMRGEEKGGVEELGTTCAASGLSNPNPGIPYCTFFLSFSKKEWRKRAAGKVCWISLAHFVAAGALFQMQIRVLLPPSFFNLPLFLPG